MRQKKWYALKKKNRLVPQGKKSNSTGDQEKFSFNKCTIFVPHSVKHNQHQEFQPKKNQQKIPTTKNQQKNSQIPIQLSKCKRQLNRFAPTKKACETALSGEGDRTPPNGSA